MRIASLMLALATLSITTTEVYAIQTLGKVNENVQEVTNYWTPERMRDAKPMPLPTVDPRILKAAPQSPANKAPSVSVPGVPPSVPVKPDFRPVFDNNKPQTTENAAAYDSGTGKGFFSSSRLVPATGDTSYPYSAVGQLYFTSANGGNYVCSASVIGKRVIVTAGHCVHAGSGGDAGYHKNFVFVPARHNNSQPFGSWTFSYAKTTSAWMNGNGKVPNAGDFALIELNDAVVNGKTTSIGEVTGQLGYATQKLFPNHLHLLGYPCNFDSCALMHQVTAQSLAAVEENNVSYGSDMRGGSSGGPWVQNFGSLAQGQVTPGLNQVVGVTSWGYVNTTRKVQGAATLDAQFTTLLNDVCGHRAGNC